MADPLQGSAVIESLRSQVREVVDRTLADPDYARKIQAIVMADPTSPELFKPPPAMVAALAEIEVLTVLKPFAQQPPPRRIPLAELPYLLQEFAGRVVGDKDVEQTTRSTIGRVNARNRSDQEDLSDLIGLFARTPEELSQLMPLEAEEELLPTGTSVTTILTIGTSLTSTTVTTAACTVTTTTTTTLTTTTTSNFCPHEEDVIL